MLEGMYYMKKKIALFTLILLLCLQPMTFNKNISLAKETNYSLEENCNKCSNKDLLTLNETGKLNDRKVINNIKENLKNNEKFRGSIYKQTDFDWSTAEFFDYGENKNGLIVSHKKNDDKADIRLLTAYDKITHEVSEIFIMESIAKGDQFSTSFIDLNGEEFVNLTTDMKTAEVIDVEVPQDEIDMGLLTINEVSAGYTSRVVNCVKSYWKNSSSLTQTFCSGACGSVIFGGNAFGVAMCASCLGASALTCLIEEA